VESEALSETRPAQADRQAVLTTAALAVFAVFVFATAFDAWIGLSNSLIRAQFPFAENQWSEGPLLLQIRRIIEGVSPYTSTLSVNSFDYGPVYMYLTEAIRNWLHLPFDIRSFRYINMGYGFVSIIPVTICALLVARRAGICASDRLGNVAVVVSTISLALALLSRSITFDVMHPDNLSFILISTTLALYYGIASGRLRAYFLVPMVLVAIVSVFTKQNSFLIAPALIIVLLATRRISARAAAVAGGCFVLGVFLLLVTAPADERAWIFFVPRAHRYELLLNRIWDCWIFLTYWEAYLSFLIVAAGVAIAFIVRAQGRRELPIHATAVGIILLASLAGYFKVLGEWNNLTLIGIVTMPYMGALLGVLVTPRTWQSSRLVMGLTVALALALPLALIPDPKQVPNRTIYRAMERVKQAANELCQRKTQIMVTWYPELFFDCPYATFVLVDSYQELVAAFPGYYIGPTVVDVPTQATYAVGVDRDIKLLPGVWRKEFKVEQATPAFYGWGANYWPVQFRIYRHV
jgi:hypothetical protein